MKHWCIKQLDLVLTVGLIVFVLSAILMIFGNTIGDYLVPRVAVILVLTQLVKEWMLPKSQRT
jgi:flagellar biosynthesis protein FliQ